MGASLLIGEDNLVATWAFETYKVFPIPINKAIGITDKDGKLAGAAIFHYYNGICVELSYYGKNTITVGVARALARVAVGVFNASRVTVITSKRNRSLMRGLLKIGFKLEGHQRCYYGPEDTNSNTGVRFVMFRERINELAISSPKKDTNAL